MITQPIVFWNLERLFAAGSHIEAALGDGSPPATTPDELSARLRVLGGVLDAIGDAHGLPALVGLAEIETAGLTTRLIRSSGLALESVEGDTADEAGVPLEGLDVTLLYDPAVFKPAVRIRSHVLDRTFDTRDVLEVDLPLRAGRRHREGARLPLAVAAQPRVGGAAAGGQLLLPADRARLAPLPGS